MISELVSGLTGPLTDTASITSNLSLKRKRARLVEHAALSGSSHEFERICYLERIPLELLAEILMNTYSTKATLAVARTSKYFCATLVNNPSSVFIWRYLRTNCRPCAIPDPLPYMSEALYASLLFDGGECENCKEWTPTEYISFALRYRICNKTACQKSHSQHLVATHGSEDKIWMRSLIHAEGSISNLVGTIFRRSEYQKARREFEAIQSVEALQEFSERVEAKRNQLADVVSFSLVSKKWISSYRYFRRSVQSQNRSTAATIARSNGLDISEMACSQTWRKLLSDYNKAVEQLTWTDFERVREAVEAEIIAAKERRQRAQAEEAYRERRKDIEAYHNGLKSSGNKQILPNLETFRTLPIIRTLQSSTSNSASSISHDLKSPVIARMIRDCLQTWCESAQADLAVTLGFPEFKAAGTTKLHPVYRVTARFQCNQCNHLATKYQRDGCLDFAGACSHECSRGKKDNSWRAAQFSANDKAIHAVSQLVSLCGFSAESLDSIDYISPWVICLSCKPATIIMECRDLIGHSQRHGKMQLSPLFERDMPALSHPIGPAVCEDLLKANLKAKEFRDLRNYGCRHCTEKMGVLPICEPDLPQASACVPGDTPIRTSQEPSKEIMRNHGKLFNFNGLRSHLKEKHKFQNIRDEDFFCAEPLNWEVDSS